MLSFNLLIFIAPSSCQSDYCVLYCILFSITRLKIELNKKSSIKVSTSQDIGSCEPKHRITDKPIISIKMRCNVVALKFGIVFFNAYTFCTSIKILICLLLFHTLRNIDKINFIYVEQESLFDRE